MNFIATYLGKLYKAFNLFFLLVVDPIPTSLLSRGRMIIDSLYNKILIIFMFGCSTTR